MLTDEQWAILEPLIEACRPHAKRPSPELRRTLSAILWRHQNGAKWRSIPSELAPWWMAAQTFIRWSRLRVWEKLLALVHERQGVELGMVYLDGTTIRARSKAAGARKRGFRSGAGPSCSAWPLSWRIWDQSLRDRRCGGPRPRDLECSPFE